MRVMIIVKADKDSEAGVLPDEKLLTEMGRYNEELVKAGILLAGEGLQASDKGLRVRFSGPKRTVVNGPFAETNELVAGYWLWQVKSIEEAIEWVKRCPNPMTGESEIEIRPVFEADDFGDALTPELREAEERMRAHVAAQQGAARSTASADKVMHFEVHGTDGKRLQEFYASLFGWNVDANNPMQYGMVSPEQGGIGGGITQSPAPMVTFYVEVADLASALKKAERLGGKTMMPPADVPGGPQIAQFADPEGNLIGLVKAGSM